MLRGRVDYVSPHALLSEALGRLGGRARLFARLGPEAAEPVDELLNAALAFARTHPPSLQGFLHWLRRSGAEVKREPEGAGDLVRIMTVHGAKGLQAKLVVLPDTTGLPPDDGPVLWADAPAQGIAVPLYAPRGELRPEAAERLRAANAAARMEEYNRLLYVALTRAEDRLVVCGWQTGRTLPETCWYRLVERGFGTLAAEGADVEAAMFAAWPGEWRCHRSGPAGLADGIPVAQAAAVAAGVSPKTAPAPRGRADPALDTAAGLPAWAGVPPLWTALAPPAEPARPQPLAPSRTDGGGSEAGSGGRPASASPLAGLGGGSARALRGTLVHALLQHLTDLPPARRAVAARSFLARPGHGLSPAEAAALAGETMAILEHPVLAPLFGPAGRAEVPLIGRIGDAVVGGLVDRLAVLADRVLIVDFKTGREPAGAAETTPAPYLRQMAAYRAVLRLAFPGRSVHCALVWTRSARVSDLPDGVLDAHAPGAVIGEGFAASSPALPGPA